MTLALSVRVFRPRAFMSKAAFTNHTAVVVIIVVVVVIIVSGRWEEVSRI